MPVEVSWYLEGRIVYCRYFGDVTLADKREGADEEYKLLEKGSSQLTHVLLDISEQTSEPTNIREVEKALSKVLSHPKKGWTIAYGKEDAVEFKMNKFINSVVTQMHKSRYRSVPTLENALEFLIYVDSSLADQIEV